jgi:RHS repeat-associated protein
MPTTNFVWDPLNDSYLMETDENGATIVVYVQEPSQYGGLLSEQRGGETRYYHQDHLGSTRFLTDETGTVTDTFAYDAWGNELARTGTTATPFRWIGAKGYYFDVEIGTYYIRARTYAPITTRWLSADPAHFVDGVNRYILYFVTSRSDPSGTETRSCSIGAYVGQFCSGKCQGDAVYQSCMSTCESSLTLEEKFELWVNGEKAYMTHSNWTKSLPSCPCRVDEIKCPDPTWSQPTTWLWGFHKGARSCARSKGSSMTGNSGDQCCYDNNGNLITAGSGAGSSDRMNTDVNNFGSEGHQACDVSPAVLAERLDGGTFGKYSKMYLEVRPTNNKGNCAANEVNAPPPHPPLEIIFTGEGPLGSY